MNTEKINLKNFTGTQEYHAGYLNVLLTDGVYIIGCNSASWLITDICSILKVENKVNKEDFVSINFKVNLDNTAEVIYTNGNKKKLYSQKYKYTDFKQHFEETEIQFFYTDNVLMLASEY